MEHEKKFPLDAKDYKLYEEVGEGVSATVYRALCVPLNEIVAIKVLDLEKCNNDLDGIRREVQTMSLIDHPNLLQAHCSFTSGHTLWVVMPYMAGGSCLHIMKSEYPEGFDEPVIATLLREVLKALVYLHNHGHIHRDVKAGNILIDSNGAVKLADFGVSACMFDAGDRQRSRNTFVGTPCWMAPEVMQQLHGYDFKADIWSFGITALELAHGHAPFSKYPPMKVLLMTLQNAPPGLDYERDKKFSKSFKEMVATCLVKDPKKRPTSEKLFKHSFFKHARSNEYLARTILEGLTPLGDRFRTLKAKEADLLVQNKALYGDKEHLSQQEYIRGISAWNFNLEDLKNQAALDSKLINSTQPHLDFISMRSIHWTSMTSEQNSITYDIQVSNLLQKTQQAKEEKKKKKVIYQKKKRKKKRHQLLGKSLSHLKVEHSFSNMDERSIIVLHPRGLSSEFLLLSIFSSCLSSLSLTSCFQHRAYCLVDGLICFCNVNIPAGSTREKELQSQVIHLQQSIGTLVEELQRQKLKNAQVCL
ncbi:hypothetical protein PVL29_019137 [Vitis rotundifolia]|uniref:Protein kinase domain-containing protein n=1 Tax=Vitis rotundifolia TaxID=103349 RepID=A0AA39DGS3_VITRO|nr:hypothetical protein PVL29_019137 [Vitis rotundifolia]